MANITKDQFVRGMAEAKEISIKEAREATNLVLGHIVSVVPTLQDGEKLDLTGVVQFEVSDVAPRTVRNPKTGESLQKGATRKVNARPMATLKTAVKGE